MNRLKLLKIRRILYYHDSEESRIDDLGEYKEIFLSELDENISLLNSTLIGVEKDPSSVTLIQDLVRAAHTVKGMSATMGYDGLTKLTHEIESHLVNLSTIPRALIQVLFEAADKMKEFHVAIDADREIDTINVSEIIKQLKSKGSAEDIRLGQKYKLIIKFSKGTRLLGARGFQAYRAIESLAEIVSSDPPVEVLEEGNLLGDVEMEIITYEDEEKVRNSLKNVGDIDEIILSPLHEDTGLTPSKARRGKPAPVRSIQSVRVDLDKLDNVVDLLGELVITRGRVQSLLSSISPEMSEQFQIFDNTISSIQDTVMGFRMVNLSRIFDTYPRAVRDIAHSRGMEIELLLQGTHIQLDRSVIDQVSEALLHLLRNAAIHGIEDPAQRKTLGKNAKGQIRLMARRERGEVVIEVEDDGRGIDVDTIRAKAIEKKLIDPEETLSRGEIVSLIFQTGFSTAETLTDIAGRGVGMDIVKTTIDEISGRIIVRTKKGVGTKFEIRVPQTLAIIDALVVDIGHQLFAIPMLNVEKIFSNKDPAIELHEGSEYLYWQERNVRIVDMNQALKRSGYALPDNGSMDKKVRNRQKIILWERGGKRIALRVDNIMEQREIVTKQLDQVYQARDSGFSGATILGYDEVALIIDPDQF